MKTLQELIKDLTGITVENWKIEKYLEKEWLDLKDTNLVGANFSDSYLRRSNLTSANLENANLIRANLENADLRGVKLHNANLSRTDLRGVKITKQQLEELIIIEDDK